jgi:hypothetical protein
MDVIDRQAALEAMDTWDKFGCDPDGKLVRCDDDKYYIQYVHYEDMVHAIKHLPSAQQWIPVTERLPEDIRPVIVTWRNTDPASYYQYIVGKRFIGVAHYKSGKWYWYSSTTEDFLAEYGRYDGEEFDEAIEVLAWCELPQPYNGEQE